ncbi:hypothetical protein B0T20DRAFT_356428 [Sordaria brevicollis]|uniref:Centrosomin N-terminal motif 1 domain-containing protein n=1 Tax=Sordaria brevicollis TaxID=83679 RepID=A0AAE0UAX1_SORBR|nr:hypothetical protein B0T20DRAFT_356428 [Sordaria brevicollis]
MDSVPVDTRSHGRPIRPLSGLRPASRESMSASSTRTRSSNTNTNSNSKSGSTTHNNTHAHDRSRPPSSSKNLKAHFSRDRADIQVLPPMSEYLQERIERTRKMEAERASGKQPAIERPKTSAGFISPIASPTKTTKTSGKDRLPPIIASELSAKKKEQQAPCMKDAQDLLSKLHKQNFDLKLELFHRRERQTALEELIEKLELEKEQLRSEQRETQDINDVLLEELEKKDKAVEEAVAMIVTLESRIENLLKEREMVRQVEAEGFYRSDHDTSHSVPSRNETPDTPRAGDHKVLHRMPSFLTEPTENTENLRNVYLGTRASELGLGRVSEEESPETNRSEFNKVGSPALSLLSESSFLSIYGQNKASSPRPQSPSHVDGAEERLTSPVSQGTPTKSRRRPPSPIATSRSSPFRKSQLGLGIDKAVDQAEEPETARLVESGSRQETGAPSVKSQADSTSRRTNRTSLQKVYTHGSSVRDFPRVLSGLPPTPDTISTSTLRVFQISNDSLSKGQSSGNGPANSSSSGDTASAHSEDEDQEEEEDEDCLQVPRRRQGQPASITAFNSLRGVESEGAMLDPCYTTSESSERPPSASDVRRSEEQGGRKSWSSEEDEEEAVDGRTKSFASSIDLWLRESQKPNKIVPPLDPLSSVSQIGGREADHGRVSPDLFAFPSGSRGWMSDAIYGKLDGTGYNCAGGVRVASGSSNADSAFGSRSYMGDSLPTPVFGSGFAKLHEVRNMAPPPPERGSSLRATMGHRIPGLDGSLSGSASSLPASPTIRQFQTPLKDPRGRKTNMDSPRTTTTTLRSHSIGQRSDARPSSDLSFGIDNRAATVPPKTLFNPPPPKEEKSSKRHYPPTASQPARSKFNSLFRRSTGSVEPSSAHGPSSIPIPSPASASFSLSARDRDRDPPPSDFGFPSWGRRNSEMTPAENDEHSGATPPPIMRSRPRRGADRGSASAAGHGHDRDDDNGGVSLCPSSFGDCSHERSSGEPAQRPVTSGGLERGGGGSVLSNFQNPFSRSVGAGSGEGPTGGGGGGGGGVSGAKRRWFANLGRVGSLRKGGH